MSCNDNQNHLVRPGRTTSRVLAPPGGQSSITFGILPTAVTKQVTKNADVADEKTRETQEKLVDVNVERKDETEVPEVDDHFRGNDVNEEKDIVMKDLKEEPNETPKTKFTTALLASQMEDVPISGNAFVSGSNMNGGCVMTGRPSSRVLAPPGGHTSFKLG